MLDQLFDLIFGLSIFCVPFGLGVLATGIIETVRERRAR